MSSKTYRRHLRFNSSRESRKSNRKRQKLRCYKKKICGSEIRSNNRPQLIVRIAKLEKEDKKKRQQGTISQRSLEILSSPK